MTCFVTRWEHGAPGTLACMAPGGPNGCSWRSTATRSANRCGLHMQDASIHEPKLTFLYRRWHGARGHWRGWRPASSGRYSWRGTATRSARSARCSWTAARGTGPSRQSTGRSGRAQRVRRLHCRARRMPGRARPGLRARAVRVCMFWITRHLEVLRFWGTLCMRVAHGWL